MWKHGKNNLQGVNGSKSHGGQKTAGTDHDRSTCFSLRFKINILSSNRRNGYYRF